MHIEIHLKIKGVSGEPVIYPITLKYLEETIEECYIDLGTPYKPIPIDNFVDLGKNQFPEIHPDSIISIKLKMDKDDEKFKINDPYLVCCKVKNVGKAFNNQIDVPKNYWKKIFNCKHKGIYGAPDGTLYISPNKENECHIATKKKIPDIFVSYSVIFSLMLKNDNDYERRYYFILDPLVKINSGAGSGSN